MRRIWWLSMVSLALSAALLVGCTGAARPPQPRSTTATARALPMPADSPLAPCVNPRPAPKPLEAPLATDFADGRVSTAFSLDDGSFRAVPAPGDAMPSVSASLAMCNLLAGATGDNGQVVREATKHGMSFGLGVVTVADSVQVAPNYADLYPRATTVPRYAARLAWLAVITPDLIASCPEYTGGRTIPPPTSISPKSFPGYQILAVDAATGTDGITYRAEAPGPCGGGYQSASVGPAVEFVSLPWTLVALSPGSKSAPLLFQTRPCDLPGSLETMGSTGQPVVVADSTQPGLVTVVIERALIACGPGAPEPIVLQSAMPTNPLQRHLIHAPVGAEDVPR